MLLTNSLPVYGVAAAAIYVVGRYLDAHYIRPKPRGLGKGAPGFLTSVKKVPVTPDIAARIARGEEEIAAAQTFQFNPRIIIERDDRAVADDRMVADEREPDTRDAKKPRNEWLPDSPRPRRTARRKR
ncbi:hypothetical protein CTheo_6412 [Ceratobasidium theobromae]|uniref:Transmembrane protein n=1 Tax=Ceratobasidium theobromae TaxID=1582974 RepID=A0A5N5QFR5_9AGAM|nr:hypothetical protein CTheo_6412 [Ceratobasidium theobromae]